MFCKAQPLQHSYLVSKFMLVVYMTQGYCKASEEEKSFITSTYTPQFVFPLLAS